MSIEVNTIFTVESGIYDHIMAPTGYYIEASNDGYARGFCRTRAEDDNRGDTWITKFTIDAAGGKCIANMSPAMPPQWVVDEETPLFSMLSFDGIVGKCCYVQTGQNWHLHGSVEVAVVDFI